MHSLELYVETCWAWSKIEKNSKLNSVLNLNSKFKTQVQNLSLKLEFHI